MDRIDLTNLIEKAKGAQNSMKETSTRDLLGDCIQDAENLLSEIDEGAQLNSSQKEVYKKLEDAVGP